MALYKNCEQELTRTYAAIEYLTIALEKDDELINIFHQ